MLLFQRVNLTHLPDEILTLIFSMLHLNDITKIRECCPSSDRLQGLLNFQTKDYAIHVNRWIINELEGYDMLADLPAGWKSVWKIADMIESAGQGSGLILHIQKLFSKCKMWTNSSITVTAMGPSNPGMFYITEIS